MSGRRYELRTRLKFNHRALDCTCNPCHGDGQPRQKVHLRGGQPLLEARAPVPTPRCRCRIRRSPPRCKRSSPRCRCSSLRRCKRSSRHTTRRHTAAAAGATVQAGHGRLAHAELARPQRPDLRSGTASRRYAAAALARRLRPHCARSWPDCRRRDCSSQILDCRMASLLHPLRVATR